MRYPQRMDTEDFVRLIETLAEASAGTLEFDSRLEDFGWDSLCVIGLISELDRLNLNSFRAESIARSETIRDIYAEIFGL